MAEADGSIGDLTWWRRQRILVVDDDTRVLELLERVLKKEGYVILTATNGQAAIDIAAREQTIDLLITDVVMRGMNGVELANALKKDRPNLPVIFTSGYTQAQIGHIQLPENAEFIEKPWVPEEILKPALRMLGPKHPNIAD